MTVKKLVNFLQKYPADLRVVSTAMKMVTTTLRQNGFLPEK